jgi:pimeloyl-ACP methyl ester carboxylesterase
MVLAVTLALSAAMAGAETGTTKEKQTMEKVQKSVLSLDGTTIAFEESGSGPAIILVASALADRSDTVKLASELSPRFRVVNYDRRGRGLSGKEKVYAIEREVEDIEALIDAVGGKAFLFGSSSGAVLALEAATRLPAKVRKLFMYEPPFIIDGSRPPMPADLSRRIEGLVEAGRGSDAVKLFYTEAMGIPGFAVGLMKLLMPGWSKAAAMAQTIPYDLAILEGTQSGKALPALRWAAERAPVLVMVGGKSEAFFHSGAKALVDLLPDARYGSLEGRDHSAVLMAPKDIAIAVSGFMKEGE